MGTRFNRCLLEKLSAKLELELRETVLGDLEELKLSEGRAAYELLGLLLRLQTQAWTDWKPWLALLSMAWPIALLTNLSSDIASSIFIQALTFWKYGVFYGTGLTALQEILAIACQSLAIILWSWTAGWALGTLSNRAIRLNWTLLCFLCFIRAVRLPFYSIRNSFIHLVCLLLLFLLPALAGTRRALRVRQPRTKPIILLTAAIATLTALVTLTEGWQFTAIEKWSLGALHYPIPNWQERLLPLLLLSWPVTYLLMVSTRHQRSNATLGTNL